MAAFMNLQQTKKTYNTVSNPLDDLTDTEFFKRYRMKKDTVRFITETIRADIEYTALCSGRKSSAEVQVLCALDYLRSPCFQRDVASKFGFDQKTVCRHVERVTKALAAKAPQFIRFSLSQQKFKANKDFFFAQSGFPSVNGIVDGTHIRIQAPALAHERDYVNRKGFHSVNAQVIVDHNGMFTNIVCRWPGCTHDSFIMRNSDVWQGYEQGQLQGIIIGDSGYALRPWLMTPFATPNTVERKRYNNALCRSRVLVEQVIGRWKRRFHSLHGELRIHLDRVPQFIMAAAVLHNICKMRNEEDVEDEEFDDDQPDPEPLDEQVSTGANARDHIVRTYFTR